MFHFNTNANCCHNETGIHFMRGPQGPVGLPGKRGPRGLRGPAGGVASYGGVFWEGGDVLNLTATPIDLPMTGVMPSQNITSGTNSLTITSSGDYELNYALYGSADVGTITLSVGQNGTPIPSSLTVANGTIVGSTIVALSSGDRLTLMLSAQGGTFTPSGGRSAYLTVKQLNN